MSLGDPYPILVDLQHVAALLEIAARNKKRETVTFRMNDGHEYTVHSMPFAPDDVSEEPSYTTVDVLVSKGASIINATLRVSAIAAIEYNDADHIHPADAADVVEHLVVEIIDKQDRENAVDRDVIKRVLNDNYTPFMTRTEWLATYQSYVDYSAQGEEDEAA